MGACTQGGSCVGVCSVTQRVHTTAGESLADHTHPVSPASPPNHPPVEPGGVTCVYECSKRGSGLPLASRVCCSWVHVRAARSKRHRELRGWEP